jgi:hypothetical protein
MWQRCVFTQASFAGAGATVCERNARKFSPFYLTSLTYIFTAVTGRDSFTSYTPIL